MRNPDRIEPILNELKTLWLKYPDLRLGQLISLCNRDVFNIGDVELITILKNKLNVNDK
jgi:hypothetical protein